MKCGGKEGAEVLGGQAAANRWDKMARIGSRWGLGGLGWGWRPRAGKSHRNVL